MILVYVIKGLYLDYKVKAYEAKIKACTKARTKLKQRQRKASKKYEEYVAKREAHR